MKPGFVPEVMPLGLQLHAAALELARGRVQPLAWLAPLVQVLARVADAPLARPDRFARVEVPDLPGHASSAPAPEPASLDVAQRLPAAVRERLQPHVGDAAGHLRVHDGKQADRVARQHRADAVSFGSDVYFARGHYQPHDARGFALLAHEAVHVAHATRPGAARQRSSAQGLAAEEALADRVERGALRGTPHNDFASSIAHPASTAPPHAEAAVPTPAQRPMAAAADRTLDAAPTAAAMDIESLRQTLMRDLMNQIRADMERGG